MHIAIVGAGITGLACAAFLAKRCVQVTVLEQAPKPQAIGAGLLLQPIGLHVLHQLDILPEILTHGAKVSQLYGTDQGRMILDLQYHRIHQSAYGVGIHRGVLWQLLYDRATALGVRIVANAPVIDCKQSEHQVTLFCSGHEPMCFDGVVVAAGTFTPLRDCLGINTRFRPFSWGAIWTIVDNPDRLFYQHPQLPYGVLRQWYQGARHMLGLMPIGLKSLKPIESIASIGRDTVPALTLFWSLPEGCQTHWQDKFLDYQQEMLALAPELEPLISGIQVSDCAYARYADVRIQQANVGRVIVLGDSAHATSPQLGQGANLGLLDALALFNHWHDDIPLTWQKVATERKTHWRYIQQASRFLTPFFQSHSKLASVSRNAILPWACRLPMMQKDMVKTLTGIKTGWLCQKTLAFDYLE